MPDLRPTVLALLLGSVLIGCSDDTSSSATDESSSSTPTPTPTSGEPSPAAGSEPAKPGATIPDGNYAKTLTLAEAKKRGITNKDFLSELGLDGKDGKATYVFKFEGDRFSVFVVEEEVPELGDLGTLEYAANKDVEMTSESEECPGCVYTYDWALVGDELTLNLVGHESTDTPEDVVIVRFVTEGVLTRRS